MTLTTQQKMMAAYNGTSLEQERQKIKAMREDAAIQASLLDLAPEQREAAMLAISQAESLVAGGGKVVSEMFLNNGEVYTAGSAALMGELGAAANSSLQGIVSDIKAGNLEGVENLKGFAKSFGPEQLKNMAEITKAATMGRVSGPFTDAISGAFVSTQKTIGKEINDTFKKIQEDFATLKIPAVHDLDNSAANLANTVLDINVALDKLVSGGLGSSEFNTVLKGVNATIKGLTKGVEAVTPKVDTPSVSIIDTAVKAIGEGLVNFFKGESLSLGTNGFQDFGSGTPAILHGREAVIPEGNASQLVKDLLAVAGPGVVAATPIENARPTVNRNTIPNALPGAAQQLKEMLGEQQELSAASTTEVNAMMQQEEANAAMVTTPMLIQELTAQVKRSSEDNARIVQQAIMNQ